MRSSPSQLVLLTVMVASGVLFTWLQWDAIASWQPTLTVHLSMGLVAGGTLLAMVPPLSRKRPEDN